MVEASWLLSEKHDEVASFFLQEGYCESREEALVILETVLQDEEASSLTDYVEDWSRSSEEKLAKFLNHGGSDDNSDEESVNEKAEAVLKEDKDNNDDEILVGPGECVLCERYMKLTRHHLVPKATWSKIESSKHRFGMLIESLDTHILQNDGSFRSFVRNHVIDICRPCHSHIHKTHDHWSLAITYNTLDRLLDDPPIRKFAQWAHQQRAPSNGATIVRSKRRVKKLK